MYCNTRMTKDEAIDFITDAGLQIAQKNSGGDAIARTARLNITPVGEGYDVTLPVEHLVRLANVNFNEGRKYALEHNEVKR